MALQKDLREFLQSLNSNEVDYLIVGAYAVAYYGFPRLTGDLDIFVGTSEVNAKRLASAIEVFSRGSIRVEAAELQGADKMLRLGIEPNRVDLLTSITGIDFSAAWADREVTEFDGIPVALISRSHLIQNKLSTGRAKDVADVEELTKE
ncbi:MAG: hypothetical protein ABIV13_00360 [Fimbriimonadales bacterium]